ncbi:hypothetical protein bcgnr5378_06380 [Bacillus cereus]|uniref:Phage ABA sandwich domain-containing protein n=1 Tax=Bacillus cereus TaxID=1396 RepID=A0A164LAG6_BACCE|nr:hypothetical protein [Bacillus cereus]KZD55601.1 hypothetical protein B4088_5346 [Bacillus cereus]
MKSSEVNKLIASTVLGYEVTEHFIVREGRRSGIPTYNNNLAHAWKVVEKMKDDYGFNFELSADSDHYLGYRCRFQLNEVNFSTTDEDPASAICIAALQAIKELRK